MRGFLLAILLLALVPTPQAPAQGRSIYDDIRNQGSIYDRGFGSRHSGHRRHHGHYHGGGSFNYGLGLYGHGLSSGYGFGYGYSGFGIRGPGYGFSGYTGPSYRGPLINRPVLSPLVYGYGPGYGYGGYGGYGYPGYGVNSYGPAFGYGSAWIPSGLDPVSNQWMQQRYNDEWTRLQAELADRVARNLTDPTAATTAVPIPSTPEAQIKSLRYQSQGDVAFREQNWRRAYEHYRNAARVARDDGTAWMKTGYALVALGRYSQAVDHFKRALHVDPLLASTGPPPTEMYGDQKIAWNSHLGRVTQWVAEDVRDSDRVLLLGTLLFLEGDPRGQEFLEKAWQLSGGREETVVALLRRPEVVVGVEEPVEAAPAGTEPAPNPLPEEELIPPPPTNNDPAGGAPRMDPARAEEPAMTEPAEGPSLGPAENAPSEESSTQQKDLAIPPLPAQVQGFDNSTSILEHQPLFPLPSEQVDDSATTEVPPLME